MKGDFYIFFTFICIGQIYSYSWQRQDYISTSTTPTPIMHCSKGSPPPCPVSKDQNWQMWDAAPIAHPTTPVWDCFGFMPFCNYVDSWVTENPNEKQHPKIQSV